MSPSARPQHDTRVQLAVDAFRRIVRALRVAAKRTEVEAGLSAAQLFVLRQVAGAPARSLTELGERTMTDRSSVAAVVDRLAERQLIVRAPGGDDRRRASVEITPAGRALLRRAPASPTELLVAALAALPPAKLDALAGALGAVTEQLGVASDPAGMLFDDGDSRHASQHIESGTPRVGRKRQGSR